MSVPSGRVRRSETRPIRGDGGQRAPRPLTSAFLSFLLPGLGQIWAGAVRRGLLFLAPLALLLLVVVWTASGRSMGYLAGLLLQPPVLLTLVVLNVAAIAYRVAAIVDAYRIAQRQRVDHPGQRDAPRAAVAVVILAAVAVATHSALAYGSYAAYDVVTGVFTADDPGIVGGFDPDGSPTPSTEPSRRPTARSGPTSEPTPEPSLRPTPSPTFPGPRWAADGRLDVLLLGGDAGPGRIGLRTDTIILASVEVQTGRAHVFGIPRNLMDVPLPAESKRAFPCGCFPDFLFGLYRYAEQHPDIFPGGDQRGVRALAGAIEELTGAELDGIVVVDLHGFIELINALGGVDIDVPYRITDNAYPREDGGGDIRIVIEQGLQHMDGVQALRFARTRHQDSDYGRMGRQQQLLVALRKQLNICALLPRIPEFVEIAKRTLTTDIGYRELPDLLELAARVDGDRIARTSFNPPEISGQIKSDDIAAIHLMVRNAFSGPLPPVEERGDDEGPC